MTDCPLTKDDLTDIHLFLHLMMLRHFQTKSKVASIERLEELVNKLEKCLEWKCPKCKNPLEQTENNEHYWMCYKCIKGYTTRELEVLEQKRKDEQ